MNIPDKYQGRFFYHFTHVDNIESIVKCGLLSTNMKNSRGISHHNVANEDIQNRRSEMQVDVGPGGVVHDYVPFYFASTNKMLLGILNRRLVEQADIVFIAVSIEKLLNENVVFTDASANTVNPPAFYENPEDLDALNWNLIDSTKWGENSVDELHARMAEVLVYRRVPLDWIESFIVFNDLARKKIKKCYSAAGLDNPHISFDPFQGRHFFFTKFFINGREKETLVIGSRTLYEKYISAVDEINIKKHEGRFKRFENIRDMIDQINHDFCVLPELTGIYELETDNQVHRQNVSDHTLLVVNNVYYNRYYNLLNDASKRIVVLAAYLHDIGKGPREKWKNGRQTAYADHPYDAIPMLIRIFSEEIGHISDEKVRKICLLVVYHDLLGDIIKKGRSKQELIQLNLNDSELYMLAALSLADIKAIDDDWGMEIEKQLDDLLDEVIRR